MGGVTILITPHKEAEISIDATITECKGRSDLELVTLALVPGCVTVVSPVSPEVYLYLSGPDQVVLLQVD